MGDDGRNHLQTNFWYGYYHSDWDSDSFAGSNVEWDNSQQPGLLLTHHDDPPEGYLQGIDSMGAPTIMSPNTTLPPFYNPSYPGNHAGGSSLQNYQEGLTHATPELVPEQRRLCDSYGSFSESAMISGHLPCEHERNQYTLGDPVFPGNFDTQAVPGSTLNATGHAQRSCDAPLFQEDSTSNTASSPQDSLVHGAAWTCPICFASLGRSQDRKRHILSHLPQWLQCPDPGCAWRADRWEVLKKHLRSVHPSGSPKLDKQKSRIYDPWPLVDEILRGTTPAEVARACAISAVKERAVELGKSRIWRDSWGRRGRRPDNLDVM